MERKQDGAVRQSRRGRPRKQPEIAVQEKKQRKRKTPAANPKAAKQKQPDNMVFALDIGTRTVIGIVAVWENEKLRVMDYELMEHPGRAMMDGQVEDIAQVGLLIGKVKAALEGRLHIQLERVSAAAAGRMLKTVRIKAERHIEPRGTVTREIVVGLEGEAIELAQAKALSADDQPAGGYYCVGYSIVEYCMDGTPIAKLQGHTCSTASVELIAAFLPNSVVEGLYASLDQSGLEVSSLTLEPIAAINVLIPPELRLLNLALVDIGAGTSDIAICRDGVIYSYDMATVAGDEITETIIRDYLVDFETAERMKRHLTHLTNDGDLLPYTNILGLELSVVKSELVKSILPSIKMLAVTVAEKIRTSNGTVPAAVFLIGGGSLIDGLPVLLGEALPLQTAKIAVGARRSLKNVAADAFPALNGPEFVTPLGIALTAQTQDCFHFFGVTVNNRKLKILNFNHMRCIEVLLMAGYRTQSIIGQSGRSLHYVLNGQRRIKKGDVPEPAVLLVNGKQANIETKIRPGDMIDFTPARHGEAAQLSVHEVIGELGAEYTECKDGTVTIDGREITLGVIKRVNGKEVDGAYMLRQQDALDLHIVKNLQNISGQTGYNGAQRVYYYNGEPFPHNALLTNGMRLVSSPAPQKQEQEQENAPGSEPQNTVVPQQTELHIRLNDEPLLLPITEEKASWYVMDLLERAGADPQNPQGIVHMEANGLPVGFTEPLSENDRITIYWD